MFWSCVLTSTERYRNCIIKPDRSDDVGTLGDLKTTMEVARVNYVAAKGLTVRARDGQPFTLEAGVEGTLPTGDGK